MITDEYQIQIGCVSPVTLHQFCDGGGEKGGDAGAGGGERGFQLVHQGHQFVHFRHDSALFGEGWEWDWRLLNHSNIERWLRECSRRRSEVSLNHFRLENEQEVIPKY